MTTATTTTSVVRGSIPAPVVTPPPTRGPTPSPRGTAGGNSTSPPALAPRTRARARRAATEPPRTTPGTPGRRKRTSGTPLAVVPVATGRRTPPTTSPAAVGCPTPRRGRSARATSLPPGGQTEGGNTTAPISPDVGTTRRRRGRKLPAIEESSSGEEKEAAAVPSSSSDEDWRVAASRRGRKRAGLRTPVPGEHRKGTGRRGRPPGSARAVGPPVEAERGQNMDRGPHSNNNNNNNNNNTSDRNVTEDNGCKKVL
ncbi:nascent polypeptide-associated complex subunit alpha, muscle-specific form-like [Colletes gigas]|uniref:nascent polypeptide-associated complex subunit alpha, muscle-specific form-like n=1 Tax=Colletes gigas TaxID=935657 RepID=UPI001C9B58D6|nr:nascent polypeptide-associated complex subunit alpha, muscle-specific form-like [Colletes gigas]